MAFGSARRKAPVCMTQLVLGWCLGACLFAILPVAVAASAPDAPKDLLPDAPGKDIVVRKCTQCHDASQFALQRKSGDNWDQVITQMTSNGLTLTDEEYGIVLDYLTKNLGPTSPAVKINVNKSSADDLEKTLQLSHEEATAIADYRSAHGPFKDWQGVAAVKGVDAKKIEAKKDFLLF